MAPSSEEPKMRIIKDPIQPHFQQLRHIKQLGTTYRVYPGASHNRFEQCLCVAHLARSIATHLKTSQPELHITARDVECVQIAGPCHDLDHGPWSHVWDGLFIAVVAPPAEDEKPWQHEDAFKMMFVDLIRFLKEHSLVPEDQFPEKDVRFILALIDGEETHCDPDEKSFLFDIVANKRNGLDVDPFDYIARDTYMMGIPSKVPSLRIIQSARVIDGKICFDVKNVNLLLNIGASRFGLHKEQYNHKTAKVIEYMIVDALKLAETSLQIAGRIKSPKTFMYLTDNIEQEIKASTAAELKPARDLLDAIDIRNLYKQVDERGEHRGLHGRRVGHRGYVDPALRPGDEPADKVNFYSKQNPTTQTEIIYTESARAQRGDYPTLMPQYFAELTLSVFTKLPQYMLFHRNDAMLTIYRTLHADTKRVRNRTASLGSFDGSSINSVPVSYAPDTPGGNPMSLSKNSQKRSRESLEDIGKETSRVAKMQAK
ncbi:Glycoside hydrolase family 3 protein [Mycena chlorophos]|uniref:Glycoside hydrolase family 3 protein n=1 Tax=Mycena chlorophos TaxID=658473 RepID=A0A8H6WKE6_MYCCL|nr:Glycoside hydrolase family 3 protein [Mycena chlorophos]